MFLSGLALFAASFPTGPGGRKNPENETPESLIRPQKATI